VKFWANVKRRQAKAVHARSAEVSAAHVGQLPDLPNEISRDVREDRAVAQGREASQVALTDKEVSRCVMGGCASCRKDRTVQPLPWREVRFGSLGAQHAVQHGLLTSGKVKLETLDRWGAQA
jgi:hypothetical protein